MTAAVLRCVEEGSYSFLNAAEDVELADLLCQLHPWAECVRYGRSGGEITTIAVRIARATTDRSKVAICGYHGWHDWYLAANLGDDDALRGHLLPGLNPLGVPRELRGTAFTFAMDDREAFDRIIAEHGDQLACVVMEPCRFHDPQPGFLEHVRDHLRPEPDPTPRSTIELECVMLEFRRKTCYIARKTVGVEMFSRRRAAVILVESTRRCATVLCDFIPTASIFLFGGPWRLGTAEMSFLLPDSPMILLSL